MYICICLWFILKFHFSVIRNPLVGGGGGGGGGGEVFLG